MGKIVTFAAFAIIACFAWSFYALVLDRELAERPTPNYDNGDIVKMKVGGAKGMIIGFWCARGRDLCQYRVRFSAIGRESQHHLIGSGGPIDYAPISVVDYINEYEFDKE